MHRHWVTIAACAVSAAVASNALARVTFGSGVDGACVSACAFSGAASGCVCFERLCPGGHAAGSRAVSCEDASGPWATCGPSSAQASAEISGGTFTENIPGVGATITRVAWSGTANSSAVAGGCFATATASVSYSLNFRVDRPTPYTLVYSVNAPPCGDATTGTIWLRSAGSTVLQRVGSHSGELSGILPPTPSGFAAPQHSIVIGVSPTAYANPLYPQLFCSANFSIELTFGDPVGACCFGDGTCAVVTEAECTESGPLATFFPTLAECNAQVRCRGACCFEDGTCQELAPQACADAGGSFAGLGSTCASESCPDLRGACCLPSGTCERLGPATCALRDGRFIGVDVPCSVVACAGACCLYEGGCELLSPQRCLSQDGVYRGDGVPCDEPICVVRWINAAGGDWAESGNWSPEGVPGARDSVMLDSGGAPPITMPGTPVSVRSMRGRNGDYALIGGSLTLSGSDAARPSLEVQSNLTLKNGAALQTHHGIVAGPAATARAGVTITERADWQHAGTLWLGNSGDAAPAGSGALSVLEDAIATVADLKAMAFAVDTPHALIVHNALLAIVNELRVGPDAPAEIVVQDAGQLQAARLHSDSPRASIVVQGAADGIRSRLQVTESLALHAGELNVTDGAELIGKRIEIQAADGAQRARVRVAGQDSHVNIGPEGVVLVGGTNGEPGSALLTLEDLDVPVALGSLSVRPSGEFIVRRATGGLESDRLRIEAGFASIEAAASFNTDTCFVNGNSEKLGRLTLKDGDTSLIVGGSMEVGSLGVVEVLEGASLRANAFGPNSTFVLGDPSAPELARMVVRDAQSVVDVRALRLTGSASLDVSDGATLRLRQFDYRPDRIIDGLTFPAIGDTIPPGLAENRRIRIIGADTKLVVSQPAELFRSVIEVYDRAVASAQEFVVDHEAQLQVVGGGARWESASILQVGPNEHGIVLASDGGVIRAPGAEFAAGGRFAGMGQVGFSCDSVANALIRGPNSLLDVSGGDVLLGVKAPPPPTRIRALAGTEPPPESRGSASLLLYDNGTVLADNIFIGETSGILGTGNVVGNVFSVGMLYPGEPILLFDFQEYWERLHGRPVVQSREEACGCFLPGCPVLELWAEFVRLVGSDEPEQFDGPGGGGVRGQARIPDRELNFIGNLVLFPNSIVRVDVAGVGPGEYDVLKVTGDATLSGKLEIRFTNGFQPADSINIRVLQVSGAVAGSFTEIEILNASGDIDAGFTTDADGMVTARVAPREPAAIIDPQATAADCVDEACGDDPLTMNEQPAVAPGCGANACGAASLTLTCLSLFGSGRRRMWRAYSRRR